MRARASEHALVGGSKEKNSQSSCGHTSLKKNKGRSLSTTSSSTAMSIIPADAVAIGVGAFLGASTRYQIGRWAADQIVADPQKFGRFKGCESSIGERIKVFCSRYCSLLTVHDNDVLVFPFFPIQVAHCRNQCRWIFYSGLCYGCSSAHNLIISIIVNVVPNDIGSKDSITTGWLDTTC